MSASVSRGPGTAQARPAMESGYGPSGSESAFHAPDLQEAR